MRNRVGGGRRAAGLVAVVAGVLLGAGGAPPEGPPFEVLSDWQYYNSNGWQALERGRLDRAEQAFRIAIKRMRPYEATQSVILARSYADLARVLNRLGRNDEAEPLARWALAVTEKTPGKRSESLSRNLELLARIQVARNRPGEAEPLLKRALGVREKVVGAGHVDVIPAVEALAELYARRGELAEAEPLYKRALALREANHAEILRQSEEAEKKAATVRLMIAGDSMIPGAAMAMQTRLITAQRLEVQARSLRESSAESISAAVATEGYSALLRRTGRTAEADEFLARGKAIRDAVETRAARARGVADR